MTEQVLTRAGGRVEVVAELSQGRTAAAQCGLFTHKSVLVIFEPPCISETLSNLFIFTKDDKPCGPKYDVYSIFSCSLILLNSFEGQIISVKN